jgi:hypothetical protein
MHEFTSGGKHHPTQRNEKVASSSEPDNKLSDWAGGEKLRSEPRMFIRHTLRGPRIGVYLTLVGLPAALRRVARPRSLAGPEEDFQDRERFQADVRRGP